ncbi:hypothetical protein GGR58DRAFT_515411 [Xylaria digitata]|nr:hypothetical protein GGR58DRAFT_515411 [Xylaria digitata]
MTSRYSSLSTHHAAPSEANHHALRRNHQSRRQLCGWQMHAGDEAKAIEAANKERKSERSKLCDDYLKTLKQKKRAQVYSPAQWPDQADDLSLDIHEADEPGIYEASLKDSSDDENDSSEDEVDNSEDEGRTGSKRKHPITTPKSCGRGQPPKKAKPSASQSQEYHLKLRFAETMEGMIYYQPENGTITFQGENTASFTGKASIPCVGTAVSFTARKTSDSARQKWKEWSDYSEAAYEAARVRRLVLIES